MIDSYEWKMPVSWGAGIFLLSFLSVSYTQLESENESNMGDGPGRSDESGNITHLKLNKGEIT